MGWVRGIPPVFTLAYSPDVTLKTHWGRVTHICVGKLAIIDSYNGSSPGRRQAIIWTNVGILLIGPLGTNFSEILMENHISSCKKMHSKMSSVICRPFCLGLNVLICLLSEPYRYKMIASGHNEASGLERFAVVFIVMGMALCVIGALNIIIGIALVWITAM